MNFKSLKELESFISEKDIKDIRYLFSKLKETNKSDFTDLIEKLKVLFINSDDLFILNGIALIFKKFKIHSAVPLIISKLLLPSFQENGGTLVYSLQGLRKKTFIVELQSLWNCDISYEMEQMLMLINVYDIN